MKGGEECPKSALIASIFCTVVVVVVASISLASSLLIIFLVF